jgi:hypothetical protein
MMPDATLLLGLADKKKTIISINSNIGGNCRAA